MAREPEIHELDRPTINRKSIRQTLKNVGGIGNAAKHEMLRPLQQTPAGGTILITSSAIRILQANKQASAINKDLQALSGASTARRDIMNSGVIGIGSEYTGMSESVRDVFAATGRMNRPERRLYKAIVDTDWTSEKSLEKFAKRVDKIETKMDMTSASAGMSKISADELRQNLQALSSFRSSGDLRRSLRTIDRNLSDNYGIQNIFRDISRGGINVEEVITSGRFRGRTITPELAAQLRAVEYASHMSGLSDMRQRELLANHFKNDSAQLKRITPLDIRNLKSVTTRIGMMEKMLTEQGVRLPNGNLIKNATIKDLKALFKTMKPGTAVSEALGELITLRQAKADLIAYKRVRMQRFGAIRMLMSMGMRGSDLDEGLMVLSKTYNFGSMGLRVAQSSMHLAVKVSKLMYRLLPRSLRRNLARARQYLRAGHRSIHATIRQWTRNFGRAIKNTRPATAITNVAHKGANVVHAGKGAVKKVANKLTRPLKKRLLAARLRFHNTKLYQEIARRQAAAQNAAARRSIAKGAGRADANASGRSFISKIGKFLAIGVLFYMLLMVVYIILMGIGTLGGNIANRVSAFINPWNGVQLLELRDDQKQDIMKIAAINLKQLEDYRVRVADLVKDPNLEINQDVNRYYFYYFDDDVKAFLDAEANGTEYEREKIDFTGDEATAKTTYIYNDAGGEIVTEYTRMKYALAMAAMVCSPVSNVWDASQYVQYATAIYNYFQQRAFTVVVQIESLDNGTKYKYFCNDKKGNLAYNAENRNYTIVHVDPESDIYAYDYYDPDASDGKTHQLVFGMSLDGNEQFRFDWPVFAVIGDTSFEPYSDGCLTKVHEGGIEYTYDTRTLKKASDDAKTVGTAVFGPAAAHYTDYTSLFSRSYNGIQYMLTPSYSIGDEPGTYRIEDHLYTHDSPAAADCSNRQTVYHQKNVFCPVFNETFLLYHPSGSLYISHALRADKISKAKLDTICCNYIEMASMSGDKYYVCLGHAPCCKNRSTEADCQGHEVCLGHISCPGHEHYCDGHEVRLAHGDYKCTVDTTLFNLDRVNDEKISGYYSRNVLEKVDGQNGVSMEDLYNTGFLYKTVVEHPGYQWTCVYPGTYPANVDDINIKEVIKGSDEPDDTGIYLGFIRQWETIDIGKIQLGVDNPLSKKDQQSYIKELWENPEFSKFTGWSDHNIELLNEHVDSDWYSFFDMSASEFIGGQYSEREMQHLFSRFGIDKDLMPFRYAVIKAALEAAGKVEYERGAYAKYPGFDKGNRFGEFLDEPYYDYNGYLHANKGIDSIAFAEWIYMTAHPDGTAPEALTRLRKSTYEDIVDRHRFVKKIECPTQTITVPGPNPVIPGSSVSMPDFSRIGEVLKPGDVVVCPDFENVMTYEGQHNIATGIFVGAEVRSIGDVDIHILTMDSRYPKMTIVSGSDFLNDWYSATGVTNEFYAQADAEIRAAEAAEEEISAQEDHFANSFMNPGNSLGAVIGRAYIGKQS